MELTRRREAAKEEIEKLIRLGTLPPVRLVLRRET
jgi:hypothetical protein